MKIILPIFCKHTLVGSPLIIFVTENNDQKKRIFFKALIEFDLYDAKNSIVKRTL